MTMININTPEKNLAFMAFPFCHNAILRLVTHPRACSVFYRLHTNFPSFQIWPPGSDPHHLTSLPDSLSAPLSPFSLSVLQYTSLLQIIPYQVAWIVLPC